MSFKACNRFFARLLCMTLLLFTVVGIDGPTVLAASNSWSNQADGSWYNPNDRTFTINTAAQLAGFSNLVNSGNDFSGKTITLGSDIDLGAGDWVPIGYYDNSGLGSHLFSGTFDGAGHKITNLKIGDADSIPSDPHEVGLFGQISTNSVLKSVTVDVTIVQSTDLTAAGGLVAKNYGTIQNCCTTGSIAVGLGHAGGLVSSNYGTISDSCTDCDVTSSGDHFSQTFGGPVIGGLAADNYGAITNCYETGAVTSGSHSEIGGLVGLNGMQVSDNADITSCYATGKVISGDNSDAGGLVGYNHHTISYSYATGAVSGGSDTDVGGEVGTNLSNVLEGYSTGAVTGSSFMVGGFAGYNFGNLNRCYFNTQSSGKSVGVGLDYTQQSVAGISTAEMIGLDAIHSMPGLTFSDHWVAAANSDTNCFLPQISAFANSTNPKTKADSILSVKLNVLAVKFNSNGGSTVSTIVLSPNTKLTKPDDPTRLGYSFAGWYADAGLNQLFDFDAAITSNITIYAKWSPENITVHFNSNGGSVVPDLQTTSDCDPSTITLPYPVRTSFTFDGWYIDAGFTQKFDSSVHFTGNMSLYAKWIIRGKNQPNTITGFLLDYTTKTVPYGTSLASLNLPGKIEALGNSISNLWVTVTNWACSTFQPNVPGTYTFKAVLDSGYKDSGYVLDNSVSEPEIKITVSASNSGSNNGGSGKHSNSTPSSSSENSGGTETKVDTVGNTATVTTKPDRMNTDGNRADIEATVPSVTVDNTQTSTNGSTVDPTKKAAVIIDVPTEAIVQQLAAKKNVTLTVTVPSAVAKDALGGTAVTIRANKEILEAAKASLTDVTIKIRDADTQQPAYSWMFRGEDLAKSTAPMTDVNISMSVHLTTEVPIVEGIPQPDKGLVLSFDHSGLLPSAANVKFSVWEKGFQPGQTLYFYYFNPTTKQIEPLENGTYTVDADGNVTVQIYHCSDYVLLPKAVRTIVLDTRTYTMRPKQSYEIGVKLTGITNPIVKAHSSTNGTADVTVLKNGNVKATAQKPGLTYIMIDVYDHKLKLLTHASVRLNVRNGGKQSGNSARQYGLF